MRRYSSFTITALVLAVSMAGCEAAPTGPEADSIPANATELLTTRVFQGNTFPFRFYSGLTERERLVIRTAAAWADAWERVSARVSPQPPAPVVDFDHEMVVLVSMGQRPTGGYSITVEGVFEAAGRLYVLVRERSPGSSCGTTQALTQPVDAVRVPRRDGVVLFVERAGTYECD